MDYNAYFNSNGKIPARSDFFKVAGDVYTANGGIIDGFKTVLGEQIIHTRQPVRTPFYSLAIGSPMKEGDAWTERLVSPSPSYKFNPKASASDALGFYDTTGYEKVFSLTFGGRKSVSTASDLALKECVTEGNAGQINNILVDSLQVDVQADIESMLGMYCVSNIAKEDDTITANDSITDKLTKLNDIAIDMKTSGTNYSDMEKDYVYADEVVALASPQIINKLTMSQSNLPSPDKLGLDFTFIPVYGGLPTPITSAEMTSGLFSGTPKALGEAKPQIVMMDKKYLEYRPYIGEYKMTTDINGAGDFRNYHILYKGAIGYKPWKNAVRINTVF